jgi:hypothetical protein
MVIVLCLPSHIYWYNPIDREFRPIFWDGLNGNLNPKQYSFARYIWISGDDETLPAYYLGVDLASEPSYTVIAVFECE